MRTQFYLNKWKPTQAIFVNILGSFVFHFKGGFQEILIISIWFCKVNKTKRTSAKMHWTISNEHQRNKSTQKVININSKDPHLYFKKKTKKMKTIILFNPCPISCPSKCP